MAITFEDKKISELPIVPAVPEFYVPAIDLSQSDPYLRNVRLTVGSIAAQADAVLDLVHQTRLVATTGSLQGGGNLSADRTLSLVGDSAAPGANRYYGTNAANAKGFHALTLGTVTSVAAGNLPPLFTTSVATPTLTPTISFSLNAQNANLVFAGPASGGAVAPTFRALVLADIPNLTSLYQPLDSDLTAIAALGTTAYGRGFLVLANAPAARAYIGAGVGNGTVTSFSSGPLAPLFTTAVATATTTPALSFTLNAQAANQVFAGPGAGGAVAPTFRALVIADIPNLSTLYDPLGSAATALTNANTYTDAQIANLSGFYQPLDADLTAIAALTGANTIYYRSGSSTWSPVVIGTGLTFSGGTLIATGGGGGGAVDAITGTANQVLVNGTVGTPEIGVITLTLPQDIATTSAVQFGNATVANYYQFSAGAVNPTDATASFYNQPGVGPTISGNIIDLRASNAGTQVLAARIGATSSSFVSINQTPIGNSVPSTGNFTTGTFSGVITKNTPPATDSQAVVAVGSTTGAIISLFGNDGGAYIYGAEGAAGTWQGFGPYNFGISVPNGRNIVMFQQGTGVVGLFTGTGLNATPIGQTTPAVGDFTNLAASGNVLFAGVPVAFRVQGGGSGAQYQMFTGAGGNYYIGYSNSLGGGLLNGVGPYGFTIVSEANNNVGIGVNNAMVGLFTQTGLNATAIGATTPSTGRFTTLEGNPSVIARNNSNSGFTAVGAYTGVGDTIQTVVSSTNAGFGIVGTLTNHPLGVYVNNAEVGRFTSTGLNATPIGATTPSTGRFSNVHVGSAADPAVNLQVSGGDQSVSRVRITNTATPAAFDLITGVNSERQDGFSVFDVIADATRLTINAAGNVGIGTTTPTAKLEVLGDFIARDIRTKSPGGVEAYGGVIDGGSVAILGTYTAHDLALFSHSATAVRFTATEAVFFGNVGIGTTSPTVKLQIASAAEQLFLESGPDSNYGGALRGWFQAGEGGRLGLGTVEADAYQERITINQAGAVGIGTTTPTAILHVVGPVRFQSFGAGTLVTDASGNIGVSAAGGVGPGIAKVWGLVDPAGTLLTGFGVSSVTKLATGRYQVVPTVAFTSTTSYIVLVTCTGSDDIGWVDAMATGSFEVKLKDTTGPLEDGPFMFVAFQL